MKKYVSILLMLWVMMPMLSAQSLRERIQFDEDWLFAFGNASDPAKDFGCGTEYFNYLTKAASIHNEGPYSFKFDEKKWGVEWKQVKLPHDWVVDLPFAKEASHSHGYKQVGYKYPETSVGWYRKTFNIPKEDFGKHIYLQFDGIFRDARVWVNGFYLGHEPSGYAAQIYDISGNFTTATPTSYRKSVCVRSPSRSFVRCTACESARSTRSLCRSPAVSRSKSAFRPVGASSRTSTTPGSSAKRFKRRSRIRKRKTPFS